MVRVDNGYFTDKTEQRLKLCLFRVGVGVENRGSGVSLSQRVRVCERLG